MPTPTSPTPATTQTKSGTASKAASKKIFAAELADWCEDDSLWPDLHPDIFAEWFDIRTATVVTDLTAEPLAREAFQPLDLD